MPVFSREEIEALLDKFRDLSDPDLGPVRLGGAGGLGTKSGVRGPKAVSGLCACDKSGAANVAKTTAEAA
jgi:hypothetical protein